MAATSRLSSKGQIVIPASVRKRLELVPGDELIVEVASVSARTLVLRGRSAREVETALRKGYAWLERTGDDPIAALHEAREKARARERRRR
jgi:AbrB family looped-hinge helix DNA binding protein